LIPVELHHLDEAALDQALLREGIRFVIEDPWRYVVLSLSRIKDYLEFWPSHESGLISNVARVGSFGICLPFMIYGLWLSAVYRDSVVLNGRKPGVILLALFVAVYSLIHLLSWALIRYRLPVDALLLMFAGLAIVRLAERMKKAFHWS
jgi:hypothetical protein